MVVLAWVDDQVAEDLAGGGVDDGDVEVLDEEEDVGPGVGSPDADVAEPAGDAQVNLPVGLTRALPRPRGISAASSRSSAVAKKRTSCRSSAAATATLRRLPNCSASPVPPPTR